MTLSDPIDTYLTTLLDAIAEGFQEAGGKLAAARETMSAATEIHEFQSVALLCRDATILFAEAVFSPDFVVGGGSAPSRDQTNKRIELALSHFGEMAGSKSHRALAKAAYAYAQRTQHDSEASEEAAQRSLLHTVTALGELAKLFISAFEANSLMQRYGFFKCGACSRANLAEDEIVDHDDTGPYLAVRYVFCEDCGWSSLNA